MDTITDISQLDLQGTYSYADYLKWQFEQRVELIKGKIFKMSPAPNRRHQKISSHLHTDLGIFFRHKSCEVYSAPFDVRLFNKSKSDKANQEIYTVVQPDICVICDEDKLDVQGCIGAPDLIVEILSPGNSKKEMKTKYQLYEEAGVREYWVVYPYEYSLFQFVLNEDEKYVLKSVFSEDEVFHSHIFPDLEIDLDKIFEN
ncbi:MAG: Uma2 family endonuclease [Bernardetiaceae bacterium]|nr:Uma2 family endonuclease [Bernardetiaceae bacterium]